MKKIICIFLIVLSISGCSQNNDAKTKVVKTQVLEESVTAFEELQDEIKKPEPPVTVPMPVVGNNKVIAIDPGHQRYGDSDKEPVGPGASQTKAKVTTGATGVQTGNLESAVNLAVALKLQQKLEVSGYQVVMVRTSQDVNISNRQRAEIANNSQASAFIRIHCNSDDSSSVVGTLTMAPSKSNPYCSAIAQNSQRLSKAVVNNVCQQTGSKNRGVMISDTMSGINWCQVPVTIIEMGFMSNPEEDRLLGESAYQDKIVAGIVLGINEYLGN